MVIIGSIITRTSHGHISPSLLPSSYSQPSFILTLWTLSHPHSFHKYFRYFSAFSPPSTAFLGTFPPLQPSSSCTSFQIGTQHMEDTLGQPSLEELNRNPALCSIVTGQTGKSSLLLNTFSSSIREAGQPLTQPIREAGQPFTQLICGNTTLSQVFPHNSHSDSPFPLHPPLASLLPEVQESQSL